jgi:curved DNA-binding protein CbpA
VSYYDVLGVERRASVEEIRRAYLRLARRYHPDVVASSDARTRSEADERMRALNEAWSVLGDPARRRAYDQRRAEADDEPESVFQPFDTSDDPDPSDMADVPYRRDAGAGSVGRRMATLAPIALFAASVGSFALALLFDAVPLIAIAAILFVGACLGFLVVPLMALSRASRDEG